MLVYVTRLWFTPSTDLQEPLDVAARWLSRKVGRQIPGDQLARGVDLALAGGHHVTSSAALGEFPKLLSITYNHPDSQVRGRLWTTEIGVRHKEPGGDLECTVLLKTSEISARVADPVQVTRPGLVTELVRRCALSNTTQGVRIHTLDSESAEAFRHLVLDRQRQYAFVVLSPDRTGEYQVDAAQLQSLLLGLADIVVIPPGTDTFWLARVVGTDFVPYHGAVRLIYPEAKSSDRSFIAARVFTKQDGADLKAQGKSLENEILSLVVHRSNLPLSWAHISPERTREAQLLRELRTKREQAAKSGDLSEYVTLQEEFIKELEGKLKGQQATIEDFERLFEAQDDTERELRFENEALKGHLQEANRSGRGARASSDGDQEILLMLPEFVAGNPRPHQSLAILEHFLPDRIRVLPEAWESAKGSQGFKYGSKLFELLLALGLEYWDALATGKSDAEARQVFGNSYAAKESESVERNRGARARRTFHFDGKQYEMMRHLKIGIKDSAAETIRVHFEWIPQDKLIVIGHCGPHIPFR